MTDNDESECGICMVQKKQLVRPCANTRCAGRVCDECLKTQYLQTNKKCGFCRENIVVNKKNKNFNVDRCCRSFTKAIYTILITFVGTIGIILLALGKSIMSWTPCPNSGKLCDSGGIGTVFLVLPFAVAYYQFPIWYRKGFDYECCCRCCCRSYNIFCCESLKNKIKYKSYVTMGILFLISVSLVLLAHAIGHPIVKNIFGIDMPFTWRSSMAGLIIYYIIIVCAMGCWIIYTTVRCICRVTEEHFSEPITTFGVIVDDESEQSRLIQ